MRLQSLKENLLPVQSEQEVAIPLLQPWPPPVFLDLSAIKPGVSNHLSEGFKGGREISNILYSLFISDPSFHFDGSSTRTLQGEGRREVFSDYADDFTPRSCTSSY